MTRRTLGIKQLSPQTIRYRTSWTIIFIIGFFMMPSIVLGASCSFVGITSINFGGYDVFALSPNNSGIGSISVNCLDTKAPVVVSLSAGQSNNYISREMMSGPHRLYYNLFTSASRTSVWGNGTGTSSTMLINANNVSTLNIFGQIPERQDANVGVYMDSIVVTVDF
jgi:spore coat protein U-like protein